MLKIIKDNGKIQDYDASRILLAIKKSAARTSRPLTEVETSNIFKEIDRLLNGYHQLPNDFVVEVSVDFIHDLVARALTTVRYDVASEYRRYRRYKRQQNADTAQLESRLNHVTSHAGWQSMADNDDETKDIIREQIEVLIHKHPNEHTFSLMKRYMDDLEQNATEKMLQYLSTFNAITYIATTIQDVLHEKTHS